MAKIQKVIRTYPGAYINPAGNLIEALSQGYIVVMANPFGCKEGNGIEYIVEKEIIDA